MLSKRKIRNYKENLASFGVANVKECSHFVCLCLRYKVFNMHKLYVLTVICWVKP